MTALNMFSFEQVEQKSFHDSCVRDSCACNGGGDCECFCSSVAAYAEACKEAGACIRWRTPTICRECLTSTVVIILAGLLHVYD